METDTYSNAAVIEFSNKSFVNVEIHTDKDGDTTEKYKVEAIPVTFLVAPDGERVSSWVGYVGPEDYRKALQKASAAHRKFKEIEPRLKASPDDPALNREAADLYEGMANSLKAAELLRKLASKTEDKKLQAEILVRLLKQLYNLEVDDKLNAEIKEVAGRLEKLDGDGALGVQDDAAMARTMVTLNQEKYEESIKLLETLVAKWPDGDKAPLALLYLGDLYHHVKKDNAAAEKILKTLIEKYPKSEHAQDAKNFLDHMKKHQDK